MEKSLLSAGTTWPGVYVVEDQRALDVLCARPDVDASRVGCAGLSGGGMRTVFLGGLDDRIRCAVAVGFMTTWRDFLLDKCFTHTWMAYVPLLPKDLDFPEILALRAPAATMVLNCTEDPLYTVSEMQRADTIMKETFERGGASNNYRCNFYPGGTSSISRCRRTRSPGSTGISRGSDTGTNPDREDARNAKASVQDFSNIPVENVV